MPIAVNPLGLPYAIITGSYANKVNVSQSETGQLIGLPKPVGNVIRLEADTAYNIHGDVNLGLYQLEFKANTKLYAEGIGRIFTQGANPLLLINDSVEIRGVDFFATAPGCTLLSALPAGYDPELSFILTNARIGGFDSLGPLQNYGLALFENLSVLPGGNGFVFFNEFGNIAFNTSLVNVSPSKTFITTDSSLGLKQALAIETCAILTEPGATGIYVDPAGSLPVEGFRIVNCEFSEPGSGTPVSGVLQDDDRTFFKSNINLLSTYPSAAMSFAGNVLATTSLATNTYYKINATTSQVAVERFAHANNRLTYTGAKTRRFVFSGFLSASGANGVDYTVAIAKNGTPITAFAATVGADPSNRIDNLPIVAQTMMNTSDYIELWVSASSTVGSFTATKGILQISEA